MNGRRQEGKGRRGRGVKIMPTLKNSLLGSCLFLKNKSLVGFGLSTVSSLKGRSDLTRGLFNEALQHD